MSKTIEYRGGAQRLTVDGREWVPADNYDRLREAGGGQCLAGEIPRHPSQLYEAFFEGLVLFLILRWATHGLKLGNRRGVVTGIFVLFYGVFRIAIETVRQPDYGLENLPLGLTMGMILSIPMLLLGAFLIWRGLREPLPPPLPEAAPKTQGARVADKPA